MNPVPPFPSLARLVAQLDLYEPGDLMFPGGANDVTNAPRFYFALGTERSVRVSPFVVITVSFFFFFFFFFFFAPRLFDYPSFLFSLLLTIPSPCPPSPSPTPKLLSPITIDLMSRMMNVVEYWASATVNLNCTAGSNFNVGCEAVVAVDSPLAAGIQPWPENLGTELTLVFFDEVGSYGDTVTAGLNWDGSRSVTYFVMSCATYRSVDVFHNYTGASASIETTNICVPVEYPTSVNVGDSVTVSVHAEDGSISVYLADFEGTPLRLCVCVCVCAVCFGCFDVLGLSYRALEVPTFFNWSLFCVFYCGALLSTSHLL